MYTFENRCAENPSLTLGDETTKIFLNTKGNMHDVDPEMQEFLSYIENTTDDFASQARSPLIKEIHKKVTEVKESREMEVEYMTLLQRDRENLELGTTLATKIIKLYHKGTNNEEIASSLQLDIEYVDSVISDYEND